MRILVVEDEKKIADFIKRGLKEEGYAVDTTNDGENGFFLAKTNDYDLILLDLMLPKLDGITICRKLREEKISAPIIMLTAKDGLIEAEQIFLQAREVRQAEGEWLGKVIVRSRIQACHLIFYGIFGG